MMMATVLTEKIPSMCPILPLAVPSLSSYSPESCMVWMLADPKQDVPGNADYGLPRPIIASILVHFCLLVPPKNGLREHG